MSADPHVEARQLILKERVEGLNDREREWMEQHLDGCEACAEAAASTARAVDTFRTVPIPVPPALGERTRMRLYLHACRAHSRQQSRWALWAALGVSWTAGVATAPLVWRGFEWLGAHAAIPVLALRLGFVLWWILPALAAAGILLAEKSEVIVRR